MKKIKNITIVGGGSAGWLTACWLKTASSCSQEINVTIIDKSKPEIIGVGEATLLDFPNVMKRMGFNKSDWMERTDATYKAGGLFLDWGKKGSSIWHPFNFLNMNGVSLYDLWDPRYKKEWLNLNQPEYRTSIENKVESTWIDERYANNIDCGKLIQVLQEWIQNISTCIFSDVVEVIWHGEDVDHLILENGETIKADLFIDCTGFNKLLSPGGNCKDLSDRLFPNTAVATRVPYLPNNDFKEMHPYVKNEAVEHGWIWTIPLRSRIGTGLVFNRDITDLEVAKKYLLNHWDHRVGEEDLKLINWDPYVSRTFWTGNTVSIGLSSGFIEPLESTGIAMTLVSIEQLEDAISGGFWETYDRDIYNSRMRLYFETAIDFVNMHYSYSELESPFWKYVRSKHKKSEFQEFMEECIKDSNAGAIPELLGDGFFKNGNNWACWLYHLMPDIKEKKFYFPQKEVIDLRFNTEQNSLELEHISSVPHHSTLP